MNLFQISSFLQYWLYKVDEHSIHSPFFFDLYTKVIKPKSPISGFEEIEKLRSNLLASQEIVTVKDLGASSKHFNSDHRMIAAIAKTSLAPIDMSTLLYRLAEYVDARQIVELGTSMGVTALYLAKKGNATVNTFEGNAAFINIAKTNFEYFEAKNIRLIEGLIDDTLREFLQTNRKINFVLMDANHQYEPTMHYFKEIVNRMVDNGVVVVDDIYSSKEMAHAWKEIKSHELVYGSVDLYRCGLVFFDPALNKQHYICSW